MRTVNLTSPDESYGLFSERDRRPVENSLIVKYETRSTCGQDCKIRLQQLSALVVRGINHSIRCNLENGCGDKL